MTLELLFGGLEKLKHEHPLELVDLQPNYPRYKEYEEEDDDDNDDDTKWDFCSPCNLCEKDINLYQRYYYKCSRNSCDYFLHKWCGELSTRISFRSHSDRCFDYGQYSHDNFLMYFVIICYICNTNNPNEKFYRCSKCHMGVHIKCVIASILENRIIYHPSHPHPLVRATTGLKRPISYHCDACGKEHMGHLYLCPTCLDFSIQSDCLFLPKKKPTTHQLHTHPLILSYSFPLEHQKAEFWPECRICGKGFCKQASLWIYKCEKCRYYVHLDCIKSNGDNINSEISKDYEERDYPNILNLPFWDQTDSLQKHLFFKETSTHHLNVEDNLLTNCHQHPLHLVHSHDDDDDDILNQTISSSSSMISLHNPREKVELLCDGCVRPIMSMPFFQCTDHGCSSFVLHEWCTRLPPQLKNHFAHDPQHTLTLLPKVPGFGVFKCRVCKFPCNGFAYGCETCEDYYIDVTCAFIPEAITHEAHPNHLFLRVKGPETITFSISVCFACGAGIDDTFSYKCRTCVSVYLHQMCALLLPKIITHKYDKHPMNLSYKPIEDHKSEYFCEICEEQFNPNRWFYHCYDGCAQSVHPTCAPVILQSERETSSLYSSSFSFYSKVYKYVNIKFGRVVDNIEGHSHSLVFAQGIDDDGRCVKCGKGARYYMIFKCLKCKYVIHYECVFKIYNNNNNNNGTQSQLRRGMGEV